MCGRQDTRATQITFSCRLSGRAYWRSTEANEHTTPGRTMANVIYTLIAILVGCYLLRWGHAYVIKRQRIDWTAERDRLHEDASRAWSINKRLARWYWKAGWWPK